MKETLTDQSGSAACSVLSCKQGKRARAGIRWSVLVLALSACEASLPRPVASDAARLGGNFAGSSVADLEQGRTLYSSRCGSCHALRAPATETPDAWRVEVHEMRSKKGVHLSDDEERRITAYLVSISSR